MSPAKFPLWTAAVMINTLSSSNRSSSLEFPRTLISSRLLSHFTLSSQFNGREMTTLASVHLWSSGVEADHGSGRRRGETHSLVSVSCRPMVRGVVVVVVCGKLGGEGGG